jgi:hypothetical protein
MLHAQNASFYPQSMLVRMGNRIFDFKGYDHLGRQFWDKYVMDQEGVGDGAIFPKRIHVFPTTTSDNLVGVAVIRGGHVGILLKPTIKGVLPLFYIWRIQRLFRRKLLEKRVLAVMMSTHRRLGERSPLACLPEALVAREIGTQLLIGK